MSTTPMTGRTKLGARSRVLLDWLEARPPFEDSSGRATTRLYEAALAAGVYHGQQTGLASLLKAFDDRGLITRTINGKRCSRIEVTNPATPELPPEVEEEELPPDIEAVVDAALDAVAPFMLDETEGELPPPRPALVAKVHLALDVDPATARLVLDLVEGCEALRPVDRLDVQRMIAYAIDKAAERMTGSAQRVGERVTELEGTVAALGNASRLVPAPIITGGGNGAQTGERPAVLGRRLGVKNAQQRQLLAELSADGWTLTKSSNSHVRVTKAGHQPFSLSSTPSDHRTPKNERTRARKAGANV